MRTVKWKQFNGLIDSWQTPSQCQAIAAALRIRHGADRVCGDSTRSRVAAIVSTTESMLLMLRRGGRNRDSRTTVFSRSHRAANTPLAVMWTVEAGSFSTPLQSHLCCSQNHPVFTCLDCCHKMLFKSRTRGFHLSMMALRCLAR